MQVLFGLKMLICFGRCVQCLHYSETEDEAEGHLGAVGDAEVPEDGHGQDAGDEVLEGADGAVGDVSCAFVDTRVLVLHGPKRVDLVPEGIHWRAFQGQGNDKTECVGNDEGHVCPDGPLEPLTDLAQSAVEEQNRDLGQGRAGNVEQGYGQRDLPAAWCHIWRDVPGMAVEAVELFSCKQMSASSLRALTMFRPLPRQMVAQSPICGSYSHESVHGVDRGHGGRRTKAMAMRVSSRPALCLMKARSYRRNPTMASDRAQKTQLMMVRVGGARIPCG